MNNEKFNYISNDAVNSYFKITDSTHEEYVNGKLYARSKIAWTNCGNYFLTIEEANYSKGLAVGDTLYVQILSLIRDTVTYRASAHGQSYELKVVKSN